MLSNKAYLQCMERQTAQALWQSKLAEAGYFDSVPSQWMAAEATLGRVSACTIFAKQSSPHYNGAAMDGIAVLAQDTVGAQDASPKELALLAAEQPFAPGCCYLIDTGDVLPSGTNAVIMIEDVNIVRGVAEITAAAAPWQHVRIIGEDIVANELLLPEHQVISPVDIAAMLAAGLDDIEVVCQPRVALLPTGDELVASRAELAPGAILDVNSHMLAAAVREWGGEPKRLPIVKDDRQALKAAIAAGLETCDMVIVNAGTSAGRDDYTADVLAELGEVLVHGVGIKPGKPVILAICQGKPVIGLPGYPVSAMLTAELFVRDIVLARQKLPPQEPVMVNATLVKKVASTMGVEEYLRVSVGNVQGRLVAAPLSRGAGLISSLTKAQGIIAVDPSSSGLSAGTVVPVRLLRKARPTTSILAVGSHDLALELLGVFLRRRINNVALSCANVGSLAGIMAIRNNEAHIAGVHLLDEKTGQYNIGAVQKYLSAGSWRLVHLAMRQQGLMVLPGNPRGITQLADLTLPDVTFVNRQRGSGTRVLLDYELIKAGMSWEKIKGYEKEVGTHMAVAATIASRTVDVGLGVQAAALALGLEFIPLAEEQYDILLNFTDEDTAVTTAILATLQSAEFRHEVEKLGGYDLSNAGAVIACGKN